MAASMTNDYVGGGELYSTAFPNTTRRSCEFVAVLRIDEAIMRHTHLFTRFNLCHSFLAIFAEMGTDRNIWRKKKKRKKKKTY